MGKWTHMQAAASEPLHPTRRRELTVWAQKQGHDEATIAATIEAASTALTYKNHLYVATIHPADLWHENWPEMAHLSIRRIDRKPVHDWRHLQQVKADIFGADAEAVELYPAANRVVDTANSYHLFVLLEPGQHFPFGWRTGLRDDGPIESLEQQRPGAGGAA